MIEKEILEELVEDHIGHAEDTPPDLKLLDDPDRNVKYLESLMKGSEQFFVGLASGLFTKVLFSDIEKVYQYDKKTKVFSLTDLEVNSEEDYMGLVLSHSVEVDDMTIPVFDIRLTTIELGFFNSLFTTWVRIPFYSKLWKYKSKKNVA